MDSPLLEHRTCPTCPGLIAGADPHRLCFQCLGPDHAEDGLSQSPACKRLPDDPWAKPPTSWGSFPGEVRPAGGGGGSGPRGGGDGCTGGAIRVHHPEGPGGHVHGGGKRQGRLVVWYWQPVPVNAGTEPVPRGGPKRWRAPRARELRAGASLFESRFLPV